MLHKRFTKASLLPYYIQKDLFNIAISFVMFALWMFMPWVIGDPNNPPLTNQMSRPVHIQPEQYFLSAHTILQPVPIKASNIIALIMKVTVFYLFPFCKVQYPTNKIISSLMLSALSWSQFLLALLRACSIEAPYILKSQLYKICYLVFAILFLTFYGDTLSEWRLAEGVGFNGFTLWTLMSNLKCMQATYSHDIKSDLLKTRKALSWTCQTWQWDLPWWQQEVKK